MKIHADFTGGNIRVKQQEGNIVYLENEIRDTTEDWFYWAFCVEDARGEEITFRFVQGDRIGYWGPAVSHDLINWHWLDAHDGENFTYRFAKNENKVYFAHSMLYHPERFLSLVKELGLSVSVFCISLRGRAVPCMQFGDGSRTMLLTARHHACESTGSYVLEGVLKQLCEDPIADIKVLCVPFVDYDGVIDGDQGKSRAPHDHNRDYLGKNSIYPETKAIQEYVAKQGVYVCADFHSPWHLTKENDKLFMVRSSKRPAECYDLFSDYLERMLTADAMQYHKEDDYPAGSGWNQPAPTFSSGMYSHAECELVLAFETTYFGTEDNKIQADKMVAFGRCFAKAMKMYIEKEK